MDDCGGIYVKHSGAMFQDGAILLSQYYQSIATLSRFTCALCAFAEFRQTVWKADVVGLCMRSNA
jgi:hypothetical protein